MTEDLISLCDICSLVCEKDLVTKSIPGYDACYCKAAGGPVEKCTFRFKEGRTLPITETGTDSYNFFVRFPLVLLLIFIYKHLLTFISVYY